MAATSPVPVLLCLLAGLTAGALSTLEVGGQRVARDRLDAPLHEVGGQRMARDRLDAPLHSAPRDGGKPLLNGVYAGVAQLVGDAQPYLSSLAGLEQQASDLVNRQGKVAADLAGTAGLGILGATGAAVYSLLYRWEAGCRADYKPFSGPPWTGQWRRGGRTADCQYFKVCRLLYRLLSLLLF